MQKIFTYTNQLKIKYMKREDVNYLESLLMGKGRVIDLEDIVTILDICKELKSKKFKISYTADADVNGTIWEDYWDHEILIEGIILEVRFSDINLIKYLKDNGSGEYNDKWDEILNSDDPKVYCSTEIEDEKFSDLPDFLLKEEDDDDPDIFLATSTRDDFEVRDSCLNKCYYYEP